MKMLVSRNSCEIVFDEKDPKFNHRTLLIFGDGNTNNQFCIPRPLKMCWVITTEGNEEKCVWVDENDKEDLVSYVINEGAKIGYSLMLW